MNEEHHQASAIIVTGGDDEEDKSVEITSADSETDCDEEDKVIPFTTLPSGKRFIGKSPWRDTFIGKVSLCFFLLNQN